MEPSLSDEALGAHMIDSVIFGHSWATPESRSVFSEQRRMQRWVEILAALARAQASLNIIPRSAADEIGSLVGREIPLEAVAEQTRATSHSTLGLIRILREMLSEAARDHIYVGITVQDVTDTSMSMEMAEIGNLIWADLRETERALCALASTHAATPMVGRTHGQPGAPITFGFKVASWADEIGRSLERLQSLQSRALVCQLGGAVGSLGFFGGQALELRAAFATELGLGEPDISWLTARDRVAEFASVLAMSTTGLARIANEVYSLQRAEIGELREATSDSVVGSITMPHKRNPESSEQIVVLARLVRSGAATLLDTMVQEHERDARGWKAEWAVFPELCNYACAATAMARALIDGIEVDADQMLANLANGSAESEEMLSFLTPHLGKHQAQDLLHQAYLSKARGGDFSTEVRKRLPAEIADIELPITHAPNSASSEEMVASVLASLRARRSNESDVWGL